jgi:3'-5' exoribonuclease
MFPEALLLHYIDDLDSKLQGMQMLIQKDSSVAGEWTGYLPSLGRTLLKVQHYLANENRDAAEEEPGADADASVRED